MNDLSLEFPLHDVSILVGVPSIDIEHHVLHSLLIQWLRILQRPESGPESNDFIDAVIRLGDVIYLHARNEEQIFTVSGMPEAEVKMHKAAHTRIIEQFTNLSFELSAGERIARTEILQLIRRWIIEHHREYDSRIRDYIRPSAWWCNR